MVKRKKRLEKGVESLKEQIELHKEKMRIETEKGNIERAEYYYKEINSIIKTKERKEKQLKK